MSQERSAEGGPGPGCTRREFVRSTSAVAAAGFVGTAMLQARPAAAQESAKRQSIIKVGVIGCGGRGTGAAINSLEASPDTRITALADVFQDRLDGARNLLSQQPEGLGERAKVADQGCFVGFDAYGKLLETDVDVVILATPPGFRPRHLAAAIEAGKHVFAEKPVATDPAGVRAVLAAAEQASAKKLSIVAGTQRRHERSYLETIGRVRNGDIGRIVAARCYWNQGSLWMNPRQDAWSDMEWQLRNWLYFTWLSGDHIVEQHVHNLDVMNWAIGAHPIRAVGMGGRQVRTDAAYGHVFDHFAVEYEYPGGVLVTSMCRQIDGCASRVEEVIQGTAGTAITAQGKGVIEGEKPYRFSGDNPNPYMLEHVDLINAIASGNPVNEGRQVAESTLTAIMGRLSAYSGKSVTWEQALNSKLDLSVQNPALGPLPTPEVAVPGRTPLV